MPNHGSSRQRTAVPTRSFPPAAWRALVQLPGQVVVATAEPAVSSTLAGLEAIAAGRYCASALVRDVVSAIYLEDGEVGARPARGLFDSCAHVGSVLADRAWREDADAYRSWIEAIAARVCHAGNTDPVFDTGGPALSPAQSQFVAALRAAFAR